MLAFASMMYALSSLQSTLWPFSQILLTERSGLVIVIGDNEGFTASETELLGRLGLPRVTVGPLPIFASHCIVLVHNHLDLFLPPYFAMKHARKALPPSEGGRLSSTGSSAPLETDRGWCSIS